MKNEINERVFFCTTGGAHKFWRVSVCGTVQTVCWGRIGTSGQTLTRAFDDFGAAQTATSSLITQKIAKGYGEVSADEARVAAPVPVVRAGKTPALQLLLFDDAVEASPNSHVVTAARLLAASAPDAPRAF